jgi:hypothetical protein
MTFKKIVHPLIQYFVQTINWKRKTAWFRETFIILGFLKTFDNILRSTLFEILRDKNMVERNTTQMGNGGKKEYKYQEINV